MRRLNQCVIALVCALMFSRRIGCHGLHFNDRFVGILGPLLLALVIAYFVRRWFIPQQLKNLQVAFEIEDDLTKCTVSLRTLRDSRRLYEPNGWVTAFFST